VKFAVAARAAPIVTTQVAGWPAQSPVHPEKVAPESGVAVSETLAPSRKLALHAPAQAMPAGALATCPFPLAPTVRLRVVALRKAAPLAPPASVAIIVTNRLPGVAYAWVATGELPVLEVPSPQSQA
jgi:hypothetical protein